MNLNKEALDNFYRTGSTHIRANSSDLPWTGEEAKTPAEKYAKYIESKKWFSIKKKSSKFWKNKCVICEKHGNLQHHHLFYRDYITETRHYDVIPVCYNCHNTIHHNGKNKNPKPNNEKELKEIITSLVDSFLFKMSLETVDRIKSKILSKLNTVNIFSNTYESTNNQRRRGKTNKSYNRKISYKISKRRHTIKKLSKKFEWSF